MIGRRLQKRLVKRVDMESGSNLLDNVPDAVCTMMFPEQSRDLLFVTRNTYSVPVVAQRYTMLPFCVPYIRWDRMKVARARPGSRMDGLLRRIVATL